MRKIWILLLLPFAAAAQEGKPFTLSGDLQLKKPVEWVYIQYSNGENYVRDSVQPKGGKFSYKGTIAEPTTASLRLAYAKAAGDARAKADGLMLYLDAGNMAIQVKDTVSNLVVKGSPAHADYEILAKAQKPFRDEMNKLYTEWVQLGKEGNKEGQQKIIDKREALNAEMMEKANKTFIQAHPASPVAVYALSQYAGYDINADKAEPVYQLLSDKVKGLPSAVAFSEQLEIAKKTGVGKMAMDFSQTDTSGKMVSLSDFKGKYVLVDFWASWCGPCRAENPNVVAVFNQYKDKGFTVLGVSLDQPTARAKWMKAIYDDKLTWTHVSDLQFWNNAVAQQYGIKAIPMNLLIDPQGKIIAKNIRGEELGTTVEKAVNGKLL